MRPQISEFSYGYALTYELMQRRGTKLKASPVFPSLRQEGRSGGGYDVKTPYGNVLLFLQFKMSHHITRKNGKEVRLGLLQPPYYRFPLTPKRTSDQHELLLELEKVERQVYYVAPAFYSYGDFAEFYASKQLWENSCKVRPSDIGQLPDSGAHEISFQQASGSWVDNWKAFRMSTPAEVPVVTDEAFAKELIVQIESHSHEHIDSYCEHVLSGLRSLVSISHGIDSNYYHLLTDAESHPIYQIARIARLFFGVETYLVSRNPETF